MKFPTVLKISEVWLLVLVVELVLAYLIFSNYAFSLAETGQYHVRRPMRPVPWRGWRKSSMQSSVSRRLSA